SDQVTPSTPGAASFLRASNARRSVSGLMWWRSAVNRSFLLCLAACRMRSSAWDTPARSCARSVLCRPAFPLVPALRSTNSAAVGTALFVGFSRRMPPAFVRIATISGSDLSCPCIIGYGSSPSRRGPDNPRAARSDTRSLRFRSVPFVRDGVFDHDGASAPCIAAPHMLPSALSTASASVTLNLYRGRDGHFWPPPAQIRACPIQALGSYLECMTRNRLSLTASRMRPCACDTASRLCVRPVLCWSAFLSVPPLPSTDSATVRTALFAGLLG